MKEKQSKNEFWSRNMAGKIINHVKQYLQSQTVYHRQDVRQTIKSYLRTAMGLALQGLWLFLVTELIFVVIISFCKAFAVIYTGTQVGQEMVKLNYLVAMYLVDLEKLQPLTLSWELLSVTLVVGLSVGILFHFFQLTEILYFSRGLVGKIICFALPLAGTVTFLTSGNLNVYWQIVFSVSLIPALCFFHYCFILPYKLLPELGSILRPWLRLSLTWEIMRQALLIFIFSICASSATLLLFEWLFDGYGLEARYLPDFLRQLYDFTNTMSAPQLSLFVVKLCLALYLTGFLVGIFVQVIGIFYLWENFQFRLQLTTAGLFLSLVFFPFRHSFIDLESNFAAFVIIGVPAFCMAMGCVYFAHNLVVNIPMFRRLGEKFQRLLQVF